MATKQQKENESITSREIQEFEARKFSFSIAGQLVQAGIVPAAISAEATIKNLSKDIANFILTGEFK